MAQPEMPYRGSESSRLRLELAELEQLSATLAGIADSITVQDPTGRLLYANPSAARMLGFASVEELLATPVAAIVERFDMLDELGAPLAVGKLPGRIALSERRAASAVVRFRIRASGEERTSEVKAMPTLDAQGNVRFAVNVFRDVTEERRRSRQAQFLSDATALLASSLDPDSALRALSRLVIPELGDGCAVDRVEPDGSLRRVAEAAGDAERELPAGQLCVPLVARGRVVAVMTFGMGSSQRVYDDDRLALAEELARRAALVVENARLFDAEREARAEAERAERRIALLAEASRNFAEASLDYGRLLELVARRAAELVGDRCSIELLSDDGGWLETAALFDVDPAAPAVSLGERLPAAADLSGSSIGASALMAPLKARGRMLGVLTISRPEHAAPYAHDDLLLAEELAARAALAIDTARAYEAERRARASAEQATRAREELLAVVSHELRSPLTTINISAAVVQEQAAATDAASGLVAPLHAIQRSVMSMQRLIQDLLDLARLESGSLELELRDHDVRLLLEQSIEMHQPLAAESGQRIVLACEPGCGRVHCDRDRTFQVLANLLGNAIKFSAAGGVIQVHARPCSAAVEIAVSDQGPGIAAEQVGRIFERYFQGQRADGRGVGLGLSIAKGIVDAHGGRIGVENLPEKGARFWFTLPGAP